MSSVTSFDDSEIETTILRLVAERGSDKTVCPSEVARAIGGPDADVWRPLMQPVRGVAVRLTRQGRIAIMRKGHAVADPGDFKGAYRLGTPRGPRG